MQRLSSPLLSPVTQLTSIPEKKEETTLHGLLEQIAQRSSELSHAIRQSKQCCPGLFTLAINQIRFEKISALNDCSILIRDFLNKGAGEIQNLPQKQLGYYAKRYPGYNFPQWKSQTAILIEQALSAIAKECENKKRKRVNSAYTTDHQGFVYLKK